MHSILYALLALPAAVLGGQIPIVDGVIGGTRTSNSSTRITPPEILDVAPTAGALRVVENSGICETTPGVYQASGYGDLTPSKNIWFWYFASRKNPETAPLSLWFNGGPGSSSMIGLFQEHGPCRITNDSSTVVLNPYSWNEESNMLYIDQPVGAGFSHGHIDVGTSQEAAADVWSFLQIFLKDSRFSHLQDRALGIWTESYGGHYGPVFSAHFLSQNSAIDSGNLTGIKLNLQVLAIGNGLTDSQSQYPSYISYAANNPYHPLVNSSVISRGNTSLTQSGGCLDQIISCNNGGSDFLCSQAQSYCNDNVLAPLVGDWDPYYVLTRNPDPYPPEIADYLSNITTCIGAEVFWQMSNIDVYENFAATGDWIRTSVPDLEKVINAGVRTLIFDGDADYILNYIGVEAMVDSLSTKFSDIYKQQPWSTYKVRGETAGQYKNAGTFSYLRVYGAGHEVAAYKHGNLDVGEAALQMFTQILGNHPLTST